MRKSKDLAQFKNILPYASEIFGVYTPLLGWKAKRMQRRHDAAIVHDRRRMVATLLREFQGESTVKGERPHLDIARPRPALRGFQSALMRGIAADLPPLEDYTDAIWDALLSEARMRTRLDAVVAAEAAHTAQHSRQSAEPRLRRESVLAGALLHLHRSGLHSVLKSMFYREHANLAKLTTLLQHATSPLDVIDPTKQLDRVGLSPLGLVHLFRQYFFEFDTFLGTPVNHIWLSPGASAELIEVSTKRTMVEKTTETSSESTVKTEKASLEEDELSDAVKEDNQSDLKFGVNASGHENWVWGSADQSASFDMATTQKKAREQTHRHMRQQSEKLSTEIRKSFKTTFRTVTETTDTSSKRYVLENTTPELINYEMRRKMRQVGVQVQDIGTYLCWQTYVDEPGRQLGVAEMVHVAKSPDLDSVPPPESITPPQPIVVDYALTIPFIATNDAEPDIEDSYRLGTEVESDINDDDLETIQFKFKQTVVAPQAEYRLAHVEYDPGGADIKMSTPDILQAEGETTAMFTARVDFVNFHGQSPIRISAKLHWHPTQAATEEIEKKNLDNVANFTARVEREYRASFIEAARDRIRLASDISQRRFEDLREEERVVVYRKLVQDMLMEDIDLPDDRTRHVVAELINSIFDVDKMLYFVAPEWWKLRAISDQTFGTLKPTGKFDANGLPEMLPDTDSLLGEESLVGWGGVNGKRPQNYYITEDSRPAKLGSSLGWLLQLDGDDLRNAFLNAPWVKAVMPVRPGKERAALNWLRHVEGMNGIGPNDLYAGNEPAFVGKTILQVLEILAEQVREKHELGQTPSQIPDPDDLTNTDNTVTATPVDKVYEHGFYPLKGGFRTTVAEPFEVFDEWIEVLPTDQVVAVQVAYDPKTGRML